MLDGARIFKNAAAASILLSRGLLHCDSIVTRQGTDAWWRSASQAPSFVSNSYCCVADPSGRPSRCGPGRAADDHASPRTIGAPTSRRRPSPRRCLRYSAPSDIASYCGWRAMRQSASMHWPTSDQDGTVQDRPFCIFVTHPPCRTTRLAARVRRGGAPHYPRRLDGGAPSSSERRSDDIAGALLRGGAAPVSTQWTTASRRWRLGTGRSRSRTP